MLKNKNVNFFLYIFAGSFLFALSVNLFIVPLGIYNMGGVGIAQIIRTILINYFNLNFNFDIAGLISFALNIPLFVLAYKSISKRFFYGTLFSVVTQTIFFTLIPIPSVPIISDIMAGIIVGAIMSGVGIGLCLQQGASGGGMDIIAMLISMKNDNFSIGKLSLIVNACIYLICAYLFNLSIAIYSLIYVAVFCLVLDKMHFQNIAVSAMIFTKNKDVKDRIMHELKRGVTLWNGHGAYTNQEMEILETIVSKYDVQLLKSIVHDSDKNAFLILSEGVHISGNYQKRLLNEPWVEKRTKNKA